MSFVPFHTYRNGTTSHYFLRAGACLATFALIAANASAQPVFPDSAVEIQRHQDQQLELQRARAEQGPDVLSAPVEADDALNELRLPAETPCFVIHTLDWQEQAVEPWLDTAARHVLNQCIGLQGLQAMQRYLTTQILARGLITSRVVVPEQSLSEGVLSLRYIPGRISAVHDKDMPGWWRTSLPSGPGAILQQRDLDQALENIRRLGGQADATIDVTPGAAVGESELMLRPGTGKRWHAYVGVDNAGMDSTGDRQLNAGLTLDSPLFLYDQFSVSWNSNVKFNKREAGARASSLNYSIPYGYWTLFVGASRSTYRQTVVGFAEPIVYSGRSTQVEAGVRVVPYRGTRHKGGLSAKVFRKRASSAINETDIEVQRRHVVGYELGYSHRHYIGPAVFDAGFGLRATLPSHSDAPGFLFDEPNWNGRSTILLASAGVYVPFQIQEQALAYQVNWQWQQAQTALAPADFISLGNRYAVRGFDGQMTLSAESGWSVRNDLSWNIAGAGQHLYSGLDMGGVKGPATRHLPSRFWLGAVVGVRGSLPVQVANVGYDLSVGWPLKKPAPLITDHHTVAFSLVIDF